MLLCGNSGFTAVSRNNSGETYTRQIRPGRAHKDRAFVLFTNMAVAKNRVTSSH